MTESAQERGCDPESELEQLRRERDELQARLEAVSESESRLRMLVGAMPDIVCFKDGRGRWLEANDVDLELFELTGVDYFGKTDAELADFSPFYREAFLNCEETDEVAWQAGGLSRCDEVIPRPDGTEIILDVIKLPIFHEDGRRRGLIVLGRDITERRRLEDGLQRAARLEAVGRLAGGIAHDFNNILTAILGHAELIALSGGTARVVESAKTIAGACRRASELTGGLLGLARQGKRQSKVFDLHATLDEVLALVRRVFPREIQLCIETCCEGALVRGDAGQIHQVLTNLVLNARDAIEGPGRIVIGTCRTTVEQLLAEGVTPPPDIELPSGPCVRLTVSDSGSGIAEDIRERIFEPFFSTKDGHGTGMGLAVAYAIAVDHGGALLVDRVEEGAAFSLVLPLAGELTDSSVSAPGSTETRGLADVSVLVVEDEAEVAKVTRALLEYLGCRVTIAESAAAGLDQLDAVAPDVLLLDVDMPGFSGFDAAPRFRARRPELPIVLMTGLGGEQLLERAKACGARTLLHKPLQLSDLREGIAGALARLST